MLALDSVITSSFADKIPPRIARDTTRRVCANVAHYLSRCDLCFSIHSRQEQVTINNNRYQMPPNTVNPFVINMVVKNSYVNDYANALASFFLALQNTSPCNRSWNEKKYRLLCSTIKVHRPWRELTSEYDSKSAFFPLKADSFRPSEKKRLTHGLRLGALIPPRWCNSRPVPQPSERLIIKINIFLFFSFLFQLVLW